MAVAVVDLTASLHSHFADIYALAIFLPSLIILLAGGFLTVDRTRSFEHQPDYEKDDPIYKARQESVKSWRKWRFGGGVGGMLSGFEFGLYLASLIALAIANKTSSAPLSSGAFLAIWMTFALAFGTVGARWYTMALIIIATLGGASVSLFMATTFHPSLTARLTLLALFVSIGLLGTFLPIWKDRNLRRWTVRAAAACAGSLGVIIGISIFSKVLGWESTWLRFIVIDNATEWDTSKEKGLAVVFVLFALIGTLCDWWLERKYGEDPAEKWDGYLATLPTWGSRAQGVFEPPRSIWQRLFRRKGADLNAASSIEGAPFKSASFDDDHEFEYDRIVPRPLSLPPRAPPPLYSQEKERLRPLTLPPRSPPPPEVTEVDSNSPYRKPLSSPPLLRPSLPNRSSVSLSGVTVVDVDARIQDAASKEEEVDIVDVSDEIVPSARWDDSRRARSTPPVAFRPIAPSNLREVGPIPEEPEDEEQSTSTVLPPGYVQTPSLIRAVDRIERARAEAQSQPVPPPVLVRSVSLVRVAPAPRDTAATPASGESGTMINEEEWDAFWKNVRDTAASVSR